jgi:hypothetical protein
MENEALSDYENGLRIFARMIAGLTGRSWRRTKRPVPV